MSALRQTRSSYVDADTFEADQQYLHRSALRGRPSERGLQRYPEMSESSIHSQQIVQVLAARPASPASYMLSPPPVKRPMYSHIPLPPYEGEDIMVAEDFYARPDLPSESKSRAKASKSGPPQSHRRLRKQGSQAELLRSEEDEDDQIRQAGCGVFHYAVAKMTLPILSVMTPSTYRSKSKARRR